MATRYRYKVVIDGILDSHLADVIAEKLRASLPEESGITIDILELTVKEEQDA